MKQGYVYIMSNLNRTTLYIGVTNNIERGVKEHKTHKNEGFTKRYNCVHLVYYEKIQGMMNAIKREKQLKNWRREWKLNLIKELNPEMKDLAKEWT